MINSVDIYCMYPICVVFGVKNSYLMSVYCLTDINDSIGRSASTKTLLGTQIEIHRDVVWKLKRLTEISLWIEILFVIFNFQIYCKLSTKLSNDGGHFLLTGKDYPEWHVHNDFDVRKSISPATSQWQLITMVSRNGWPLGPIGISISILVITKRTELKVVWKLVRLKSLTVYFNL